MIPQTEQQNVYGFVWNITKHWYDSMGQSNGMNQWYDSVGKSMGMTQWYDSMGKALV